MNEMIAQIEDIIKAQRKDEEPRVNPRPKPRKNALTRLNNEIVKLEVKEAQMLDFFKDLQRGPGYDD